MSVAIAASKDIAHQDVADPTGQRLRIPWIDDSVNATLGRRERDLGLNLYPPDLVPHGHFMTA